MGRQPLGKRYAGGIKKPKSEREIGIRVTAKALLPLQMMSNKYTTMTYDEFNNFCRELPATSYVVQWGGSHVWKVGGKVFAIGGWGEAHKPAYSFKVSENNFHFLANTPGYKPAPYLASRGMKWIQQFDGTASEDEELRYYLKDSYRIVALGLSKKRQKELGLTLT